MPSRSEIERQRDRYARESDRIAGRRYNRMRGPLWSLISGFLDGLSIDTQGRIRFSVGNISTANRIGIAVQTFNSREGVGFLQWIFGRLSRLLGLNKEYFGTMPDVNPESVEDRVRRLTMLRYGFNPDTGAINPEGYLAANIRQSAHAQAVAQRINQAIASRMSLNKFKTEFRREFQRAGSPLSVKYHYDRFARDIFQEFDRTTQLVYAEELGLAHAIYSGTIKNNTRCFCERRTNRIYEEQFMIRWNGQNWQGKKPGVDVRIALGGFNCRHILSWVTEGTAKALEAKRDQKINSYNKTLC